MIERWRNNTAGRQHTPRGCHTAATQVPWYCSMDFSWTPFYMYSWPCVYSIQNCAKFHLTFLPKR